MRWPTLRKKGELGSPIIALFNVFPVAIVSWILILGILGSCYLVARKWGWIC